MAQLKHCLFVVDDEPDLVQSVKDLLRFDFRVLCATRASEGLDIMRREQVHIVMSDQRMPEMTGVQFLSFLKDQYPKTVRLLFTAYADLKAVTDAINQGNVYRYISKPWEPDELKIVLRQAVDFYELQEERRGLLLEVQEKNRLLECINQELSQANDLKRAFIRVAGHELRTPLTVILGLAELGTQHPNVPSPLNDWLTQIHRYGQRLNERVDQIMKMLLTEQFERSLQVQEVDLGELVRGAAADVASFIAQRKQTLHLDLPDLLGNVLIERAKLHDSLVQVLVNAIKFTPDQGTIRLAARRSDDRGAEITIADSGQGIDPSSLAHIFDPFFTRFDVSRHASGDYEYDRRGLGLGLSVVKAFIEMHGGRVKVQSQIGQGTTFTIVLPPPDEVPINKH